MDMKYPKNYSENELHDFPRIVNLESDWNISIIIARLIFGIFKNH